jgi:thioredoxin-related protein
MVAASAAMAADFNWESDYNYALELAKKQKKMVMVMVYTDWCGYCRKMDKETYADADVAKKIKADFIAVKINPDKSSSKKKLAAELGARGYPHIAFVDAGGNKVDSISGYLPAKSFLPRLEKVTKSDKK